MATWDTTRAVESPVKSFRSLGEVASLVEQIEDCTLPVESWDHTARLTVALWYLLHHDECLATERFIRALRGYYRVNGLRIRRDGGYHETLTLFWLAIARRYLRRRQGRTPGLDLINDFIREFDPRRQLVFEYYRRRTLGSDEARYFWVEPDLKPFD